MVFFEMAVDEVAPEFHLRGRVTDDGNPALASVGVPGELEVEGVGLVKIVEWVGLMNEGEDRGVLLVASPGEGGVGVTAPD